MRTFPPEIGQTRMFASPFPDDSRNVSASLCRQKRRTFIGICRVVCLPLAETRSAYRHDDSFRETPRLETVAKKCNDDGKRPGNVCTPLFSSAIFGTREEGYFALQASTTSRE